MRTGAIFARGSCRALKWMALVGMVFAFGAGEALAQDPTIGVRSVTVGGRTINTVPEGQLQTVTVTLTGRVPRTTAGTNSVVITLTEGVRDAGTSLGDMRQAEAEDVVIPNVTITIPEQSNSGSATFVTGRDGDAVDERFSITATAAVGDGATGFTIDSAATTGVFMGTIDDAEEQTYELRRDTAVTANKPMEGSTFDATLKANPDRPTNETVQVYMYLDTPGYSYLNPSDNSAISGLHSVMIGAGTDQTAATGALVADIRVRAPSNDRNRTDDTIQLQGFVGSAGRNEGIATLDVVVADVHKLPDADAISAEARDEEKYADGMTITSVEEGGKAYVFVMVENTTRDQVADDERFSVSLSAASTSQLLDFKVTPSSITVPARDDFTLPSDDRERVGPFTLEALIDEDIGMETLMLNIDLSSAQPELGRGAGTSMGSFSIEIEDATSPLVWAKEGFEEAVYAAKGDGPMHPGNSFEIMTSDLFEMADGIMVAYSATSDSAAVSTTASNAMVTVMGEEAGMAHITVTATATMSGVEALPQTMSNIAQIKFPVEVVLADLSVRVAPDSPEIMEGSSTMLTATATRPVAERTKISLSVVGDMDAYKLHNELGEDVDGIEIPAGTTTGVVTLSASEDDDYMDETLTVVATGPGIDGSMQLEIMVTDNDEAPVDEPTVRANDGAADLIAAAISRAAGDAEWMVGGMVATVDMSELFDVDEGVTVIYSGVSSDEDVVKAMTTGGTMLALTPMGAGTATITITGSDLAGGGAATVTHDAIVVLQTLRVTVTADAHMVDEGGSVTLTAKANRAVTAETMLALTMTGDIDAVEAPESLTLGMGEDMGTAMVMAMEDADTADEMVTVVVTGPGIANPVSIEIGVTDNDRTVVAKSQEQVTAVVVTAVAAASGSDGWLPDGDAAMVDMSELFTIDDGATVEYMVESSAEDMVTASASGSMLTLTPMATGAATITVKATDTSGDADDHAMVMADVEVGVLPLMVELHGPDDMNLVEGNSYEIKAMANRAVTEDTTVEIMRDRAESSAGGDDYSVENITIAAGETMGATMVMVTDDGPGDAGAGMPEKLVLYGMVGNMQTNSLTFNLWDAAVPALPIIAQLLLAAFLAIGGYRRYRRR